MTLKLRFLSSALDGQTFTLTASQGGPAVSQSFENWGAAADGGPIAIEIDRTTLQIAPDRVRYNVDLSNSAFETTDTYDPVADKTYSNGYNPASHDLIYIWDTGDSGSWEVPVQTQEPWRNPTAWRSKLAAKGPMIQHVYDTPGSYTVGVLVIEPSTGKAATATAEIAVRDPDAEGEAVFPGINTICINPLGDSDFSGAPAGATLVNANQLLTADTLWTSNFYGNRKRWLFKRGGSFDVALRLRDSVISGSYFGAYGAGAKPVLNFVNGSDMFELDFFGTGRREIRFTGLKLQGTFDPTVETVQSFSARDGYQTAFGGTNTADADFTFHDLEIVGCAGTLFNLTNSTDTDRGIRYAIDSLYATDYGGEYNLIVGRTSNTESTVSLTGSRIVQNPNSISDDTIVRATVRTNAVKNTYIAKNDILCLSENNPAFRLCDGDMNGLGAQLVNVNENIVECNTGFAGIGYNLVNIGAKVNNTIIDSNIMCGAWNTNSFFRGASVGVTIRNNIAWQPNIRAINGLGVRAWYFYAMNTSTSDGQAIPDAPVRVFSNTFVNDRNDANNNNAGSPIFGDQNGQYLAAGVSEEANNLVHLPNLGTPQIDFAPLSSDLLFAPRSTVGRVAEATLAADSSRSTNGNMQSYVPMSGSQALGDASLDRVSHLDIFRNLRPVYPSVGAWENESI